MSCFRFLWGREKELFFFCYRFLVIKWFLFEEVSSWCLGYAALFYCGTL